MKSREVKEKVINTLKSVFDPEIGINVYDLGLIYGIDYKDDDKSLYILLTFTSFACPFADVLLEEIKAKLEGLEEVENVTTEVTFDPPWSLEMMTEEGRLESGLL